MPQKKKKTHVVLKPRKYTFISVSCNYEQLLRSVWKISAVSALVEREEKTKHKPRSSGCFICTPKLMHSVRHKDNPPTVSFTKPSLEMWFNVLRSGGWGPFRQTLISNKGHREFGYLTEIQPDQTWKCGKQRSTFMCSKRTQEIT